MMSIKMRYFLTVFAFTMNFAAQVQAQESKNQRINRAIDLSERICVVGNRVKFSFDTSGNLTIKNKYKPGVEGNITIDAAQAKGSQFFENEKVRSELDKDIRICMQTQWPSVLKSMRESESANAINVCFSDREDFCPGPHHERYYDCSVYRSMKPFDRMLSATVCNDPNARVTNLNESHGGDCGWHLFRVVCPEE